jgi:hypothetical protein
VPTSGDEGLEPAGEPYEAVGVDEAVAAGVELAVPDDAFGRESALAQVAPGRRPVPRRPVGLVCRADCPATVSLKECGGPRCGLTHTRQ